MVAGSVREPGVQQLTITDRTLITNSRTFVINNACDVIEKD